MERSFSKALSELRKSMGFSQRKVASDLNISQALLSHYENGAREPGLMFVRKVCDYYGVSADYLLGRTNDPKGISRETDALATLTEELRALTQKAEQALAELQ
ncbi:MAG TPA: helix-turn-helix transcriptional regulator [Clostridiales bacterium]|jgi:transcriptional regulator with XRE-family HTH domain|nr:helix-turn-helix transcriptional regulator [Clostridiales bacterium]